MSYKILLAGSLVLLALGLSIAVVDAQRPPPGGRRSPAAPVGTGFTYQGQLKNNGALVNGSCDFQFGLWDDPTSGPQYGATQTVSSLPVTNGLFTTQIDFGGVALTNYFTGTARYLQVAVNCGGGLTTLSPRQPLTPAPYALALPGLYTQQDPTSPNVVGGHISNTVSGGVHGATIGGGGQSGFPNRVSAIYGTIGGGWNNTSSNIATTVGGGTSNTANGIGAFVGGGGTDGTNFPGNVASGNASTIGGGISNTISAIGTYATIGGGISNTVSNGYATIGGGNINIASGYAATIGGGQLNTASGGSATIGGGVGNSASKFAATIGGGQANVASRDFATVGGGLGNHATMTYTTIGGGYGNIADGSGAFIGGGGTDGTIFPGNVASGIASTIGGGISNTISAIGNYATIGGGISNTVSNQYATVGGGLFNTASGPVATIGGGISNTANYFYATVGGGAGNTASGQWATIGGGDVNTIPIIGSYATIGGGFNNTASGFYATVPGGQYNVASGNSSFAAGNRANTNNQAGAFVWGDGSTSTYISATFPNQFLVRASGGITMYTNSLATIGSTLQPGSGTWSMFSDRHLKDNFVVVNGREVLLSLAAVPIQTWNYKTQDASIRHIGPMAQDFYAAFNVGEDDKHITTVDADGVAFAAIQGLYQVVQEKDAEITSQQKQIETLEARVAALERKDPKGFAERPRSEAERGGDPSGLGLGDWNAAMALVIGAVSVIAFGRARKGGAR